MDIDNINIIIIDKNQSILTSEGCFRCSGCLIEDNRMLISTRDEHNINNLVATINHEFLHVLLQEIDGDKASYGLDTINGFYTYPIEL